MWSLINKMGSAEPKLGGMQKGGCQVFHSLMGHTLPPFSDKQFVYVKNAMNLTENYSKGVEKPLREISSSRTAQGPPISNPTSTTCNSSKKKKKRRRRRKKKTKSDQTKNRRPQRPRQISIAESDDSFIICFDEKSEGSISEDFDSLDSLVPQKKVRFATDDKLCEVHPMIMWSYAYQAARKGPWEECARDRDRFYKRVVTTETLIGHVFAAGHRARIYKERFASDF